MLLPVTLSLRFSEMQRSLPVSHQCNLQGIESLLSSDIEEDRAGPPYSVWDTTQDLQGMPDSNVPKLIYIIYTNIPMIKFINETHQEINNNN